MMYLLQFAGEPLRLRYTKADYGPYAENLRHVLRGIEGHFISGYSDDGDAPNKQLSLVPGAITDANAVLDNNSDTSSRLERVIDLVQGFETPFGLELLSTVHWVIAEERALTVDEVVERTYSWNLRKQMFYREQIILACEVLESKGWLPEGWRISVGEQISLL